MPSLWLEEEGEQFQDDLHTHNNDIHPPYSNEAQNPVVGAGSPAGPHLQTQMSYSAQQQLPSHNARSGTVETIYSPGPYSWGAAASTPMISKQQRALDLMIEAAAQYPDDIDRSRWNNNHLPAQGQPDATNNDLSYSPAFSDSPVISSSVANARHSQPRRRSSDIDSLFEDSDEPEEEIYVLQRRDEGVGNGDDKDSPASALLTHAHDLDTPSPCGLSRQLQGQLNVLSSEIGQGKRRRHHRGDFKHKSPMDMKKYATAFQHNTDSFTINSKVNGKNPRQEDLKSLTIVPADALPRHVLATLHTASA
ncbi:uncharacterized protein Z520_07270 [Fonsecaea multimorphosa CBS 102226]|uniref:Uncharacterized protein n=1 Tax=Fonsecaea multimorphosa CBS 102226 TaxID=1442371 RepID=A0A0D2IJB7_9EURO|nr:uncharacterized protein Z520_07270 [Fonsecaea multimorphosa CBS 102226]KIX97156.1 hypothetical protein Z520_07270 [Fonsecaea multimorphosa CBS 102226]